MHGHSRATGVRRCSRLSRDQSTGLCLDLVEREVDGVFEELEPNQEACATPTAEASRIRVVGLIAVKLNWVYETRW